MTSQSFPVIETHPALSDHGRQAEAMLDDLDGPEPDPAPDLAELVLWLRDQTDLHPLAPSIIVLKASEPGLTVRALARRLRCSKSLVAKIIHRLRVDNDRADFVRVLLGFQWRRHRHRGQVRH